MGGSSRVCNNYNQHLHNMASDATWPEALKNFVASSFAQCNDTNREKVEAEIKKRIFEAFTNKTLWTTNWAEVQLDSLKPSAKRKKPTINAIPSAHLSAAATAASSSKFPMLDADTSSQDELDMRQKRAKRFQQTAGTNLGLTGGPMALTPNGMAGKKNGKGKMKAGGLEGLSIREQRTMSGTPDPVFNPDVIEWDEQTIVGTSRQLEKPYLRLTSAPDPRTVRPLAVLRQTLEHLKRKWRSEGNYAWVCDQFKSVRQDLTVQRIKNDFTVMVYEIHARIALEKGDLGEYNQCQSQLRELYKHGLQGHPMEFLAYRILYLVHTKNRSDFNSLLASLTSEQREDESVKHALAIRSALATSNYYQFFKLFLTAPKMGPYMIDHFIDRERVNALVVITKAYKSLPLTHITNLLAFDDAAAGHDFLTKYGAASYLPEAPEPAPVPSKPISISLAAKPKSVKPTAVPGPASPQKSTEADATQDKRQLDCKAAYGPLQAASLTFNKVDIKGQI